MIQNPYLPHTEEDIAGMLRQIGINSIDELFADIPNSLRQTKPINLPAGLSESEVRREMTRLAARNQEGVSFLGGGSYEHFIPAVVRYVQNRSEFLTAYTPYQAEISQGILQAIFEYQTLICLLTGLDVSNASLYDGHTAAAEACAMAINTQRGRDTILVADTIHPFTKQVLDTYFSDLGVRILALPSEGGTVNRDALGRQLGTGVAGVLIQTPNFFGIIEDLRQIADMVKKNGSVFIVSANPLSLGALRSPEEWGADIAVGDAQTLGLSQYYGGPTAGYIACKEKFMRKLPGRIAGQSVDSAGRRAFVLTLQAREQHIKRERATSNICTNQALAGLGVAAHLCCLGKRGIVEVAERNIRHAHYMQQRLVNELPVFLAYDAPFFNEFVLSLPQPSEVVLNKMEADGFFAGIVLYPLLGGEKNHLLVAVTEERSREEIDSYVDSMKRALA